MADKPDFSKMSVGDLRTLAESLSVENTAKMKKGELIASIEMKATMVAGVKDTSATSEKPVVSETPIENVGNDANETAENFDEVANNVKTNSNGIANVSTKKSRNAIN